MKGTVKWYSGLKSYGFIEGEDGNDIFVHQNSLEPSTFIHEGDEVTFEVEKTDKGPAAIMVKKI